jgi:hypothetical protein
VPPFRSFWQPFNLTWANSRSHNGSVRPMQNKISLFNFEAFVGDNGSSGEIHNHLMDLTTARESMADELSCRQNECSPAV